MTIQLAHQIQLAEQRLTANAAMSDPRFVPDERFSLREVSARFIRSSANSGLRLADRLDPACHPA